MPVNTPVGQEHGLKFYVFCVKRLLLKIFRAGIVGAEHLSEGIGRRVTTRIFGKSDKTVKIMPKRQRYTRLPKLTFNE
jgi:hypothetical protein